MTKTPLSSLLVAVVTVILLVCLTGIAAHSGRVAKVDTWPLPPPSLIKAAVSMPFIPVPGVFGVISLGFYSADVGQNILSQLSHLSAGNSWSGHYSPGWGQIWSGWEQQFMKTSSGFY